MPQHGCTYGVWDEAFRTFAILPESVELTAEALILCSLTQDLLERKVPCWACTAGLRWWSSISCESFQWQSQPSDKQGRIIPQLLQ